MNEVRGVVAGEAILTAIGTTRERDAPLDELVLQHARLVYRISLAALRNHHDAEDATQETFLRVLRYSHKLAMVKDPKTWLARIAWRVAVGRSRRDRGKQEVPLDEPGANFAEPTSYEVLADQKVEDVQTTALLEQMIEALPRKLRGPLVLSAVEEMAPHEVAATLDISEAAVRSRVFRARQILKDKMANRLGRK